MPKVVCASAIHIFSALSRTHTLPRHVARRVPRPRPLQRAPPPQQLHILAITASATRSRLLPLKLPQHLSVRPRRVSVLALYVARAPRTDRSLFNRRRHRRHSHRHLAAYPPPSDLTPPLPPCDVPLYHMPRLCTDSTAVLGPSPLQPVASTSRVASPQSYASP